MYQFYYAASRKTAVPRYEKSIENEYCITAIRPTMWEEHCLECAAPQCFGNCPYYQARADGRCKRFYNGIEVRAQEKGCCERAARVRFRRWGNMMTVVFPGMATAAELKELNEKNDKLGEQLRKAVNASLPMGLRWQYIRTWEYLRRRKLRAFSDKTPEPDAFVFHCYSFESEAFRMVMEVYDGNTPVFRTSMELRPGENLYILEKSTLSPACWKAGNLVKLYPENNLEAEIEILWADFVQGKPVPKEAPADKVKCVVWDLDNTFWDGILIETDDPNTLQPFPGVLDMVHKLDEKGILQSIASKNDYAQAWPVLERLGVTEYFLYPQINWGAKSTSIRTIAESLNIGVDTFALLDDSPFERNQVSAMLPQVRTYDPVELGGLTDRPEFDVPVTAESRSRREMYRAEEKRAALMENSSTDTVEFLKMCHLRMKLFVPRTEEEILRSFELAARTNQLNMSGNKYTPEEFDRVLAREGHTNFGFSCEDDFGTYGIVGFGQYRKEDKKLVFTEFAMSCRVAGKYVESALFTALLEREGCESGVFAVKKTKKNILLRRTLEEIGFKPETDTDREIRYLFDASLLNKELVSIANSK